jgi:hypothetical protein
MKTLTKNCLNCQKAFEAPVRDLKRGRAKYCSLSCSSIHTKSLKPKPKSNCICAFCSTEFYLKASKLKASKSGLYFCKRVCKDAAQRIEFGLIGIHPAHYNNGTHCYRDVAFRNYKLVCNRCGYSKHPEVLEVHHRNCNRTDNSLENLEIICPTCHEENHFLEGTGKWRKS